MLSLVRLLAVGSLAHLLVAPLPAAPFPTDADFKGNVSCEATGCTAFAESHQQRGPSGGGSRSGNGGALAETSSEPACEEGEDKAVWTCTAWVEPASGSEEPTISPRAVAEQSRASMSLPRLSVDASPGFDATSIVHFPLWLWVDGAQWEPVSATASVSSGSVTVTATPDTVRWDMGDGTVVECDGPGTVFSASFDDAGAPSPDCGHTYTRASTGQPHGRFPVTATLTWTVEWTTTTGGGGSLDPLTTSASRGVRVREVHALVTGG
ncbi:hypothetical protein [Nocardiopsis lucentensis]|uniref:hypothetical protein n=1 Tax=Nocardiopsis lucentensis TaxID=53441 RepID=UPI000349F01D|nr:hypothetical protein [Nocardiopsis lucentensis]